jgi:transcriptional regulator with XRE-family HTH domain
LFFVSRRIRHLPPTPAEAAVGLRMRAIRKEFGASVQAMARLLGQTRNQLNAIERGETSVRLGTAWEFCELTQTNPEWLAFGEPHTPVSVFQLGGRIPEAATSPFLEKMLARDAGEQIKMGAFRSRPIDLERARIKKLAAGRALAILNNMSATDWLVGAPQAREGLQLAINSALPPQAALDRLDEISIYPAMSRWDVLRRRLQKVVAHYGAKSKIARAFGVTRQAVDQWIKGYSAPKAETALRLLEWVTTEEAKQKQGAGRTRPARRTQARKSKHEKPPHSDRKKK